MTQIDYSRAAKYFLLYDFIVGFKLGMKYFFRPKVTLNYPHEKGYLSPRFRGQHLDCVAPSGQPARQRQEKRAATITLEARKTRREEADFHR